MTEKMLSKNGRQQVQQAAEIPALRRLSPAPLRGLFIFRICGI